MATHFDKIIDYWQSNYSKTIPESKKFEVPEHFKRMANLMAPGKSFYYIANFQTLELELVSESVEEFIGEKASFANMDKLLALALPSEIEKIHRKEQVIQSFFIDYLRPKEMLDYKITYTYKNKAHDGKVRVMLHQATVLTLNESGQFIHVFSIHSDISHLSVKSTEDVSFLNINGGPSYYNVETSSGKFNPKKLQESKKLKELLTLREIEVVRELALGKSVKEIAISLNLSSHTVKTHKKNILGKVECNNSTHLVTICLAEGLINI
ncbi:LuxR C-terminal-related transcriptional regulator [Christiangramia echinicola]|uniref:LuxR C-terminal-related transcriptional regulator n=1 Tax=Christiangramia echinicola TaxID=279359 RepID=UPI00040C2E2D|nr:LuxR C-terminal-related transcriptional regulator [Christiangramia echinicola]